MTIDQKALEKARDAYRRETLPVYPIVPANHDKALETAITAYITGLPASDHAGLASRVFYPVNNPSAWPDGFNQNISDLLREAATVIQTLQRDLADRDMQLEASATVALELSSRAEAAEKQVRDMLDALNWALGTTGEFRPSGVGTGPFWWRAELAARAGLTFDREAHTYRLLLKEGGE